MPAIVISSDEAPEISVQTPRSTLRDMPRRATSIQPVGRSPRLLARAAASANPAEPEPASPPPEPAGSCETSKNPIKFYRLSAEDTRSARPTETASPEHPAPDDIGRSNSSDMSDEDRSPLEQTS